MERGAPVEVRVAADKLEWKPNPGQLPPGARGKRVRVKLRGTGREPVYDDHWNPMSPPGWAADGRGGCNWALDDAYPFSIIEYAVIR